MSNKKPPPTKRAKSAGRDELKNVEVAGLPPADTVEGLTLRLLNPTVDPEEAKEYDRYILKILLPTFNI
jgi:hypothetical protein